MNERLDWKAALRDPRALALCVVVLAFAVFAGFKMVGAFSSTPASHAPDLPAPAFINHQIAPLVERGPLLQPRLPEDAYRQAVSVARAVASSLIRGTASLASLEAANVSTAAAKAARAIFAHTGNGQLRSAFTLQRVNGNTANFSADFVTVRADGSPVYGQIVVVVSTLNNWATARLTDMRVAVQSS